MFPKEGDTRQRYDSQLCKWMSFTAETHKPIIRQTQWKGSGLLQGNAEKVKEDIRNAVIYDNNSKHS